MEAPLLNVPYRRQRAKFFRKSNCGVAQAWLNDHDNICSRTKLGKFQPNTGSVFVRHLPMMTESPPYNRIHRNTATIEPSSNQILVGHSGRISTRVPTAVKQRSTGRTTKHATFDNGRCGIYWQQFGG